MTKKHVPQRTCVACRQTTAKRTLIRIVRIPDQGVHVDPSGKQRGRGAYLCDQPECWKRALETDILEKALRTTLTEDDRKRLSETAETISAGKSLTRMSGT